MYQVQYEPLRFFFKHVSWGKVPYFVRWLLKDSRKGPVRFKHGWAIVCTISVQMGRGDEIPSHSRAEGKSIHNNIDIVGICQAANMKSLIAGGSLIGIKYFRHLGQPALTGCKRLISDNITTYMSLKPKARQNIDPSRCSKLFLKITKMFLVGAAG